MPAIAGLFFLPDPSVSAGVGNWVGCADWADGVDGAVLGAGRTRIDAGSPNGGRRGDLGDFVPLDGLVDLDGVAALLDCCDLAFI
jgi:hypothetical protein